MARTRIRSTDASSFGGDDRDGEVPPTYRKDAQGQLERGEREVSEKLLKGGALHRYHHHQSQRRPASAIF